ncbi:MAG: hypothetical protein AABX53_01935 [Nanoarchaeota archaeon]
MNLTKRLTRGVAMLASTTAAGGYISHYLATPNQKEQLRAQTILPTTQSRYESANAELQRAQTVKDVDAQLYDTLVNNSDTLRNDVDNLTRIVEGTAHPAAIWMGASIGLILPLMSYGIRKLKLDTYGN